MGEAAAEALRRGWCQLTLLAGAKAEGDQGFGNAASIDALVQGISGLDDASIKADIAANKDAYDKAAADAISLAPWQMVLWERP